MYKFIITEKSNKGLDDEVAIFSQIKKRTQKSKPAGGCGSHVSLTATSNVNGLVDKYANKTVIKCEFHLRQLVAVAQLMHCQVK